jgi:radical SAM protein (TIGR01212 family)
MSSLPKFDHLKRYLPISQFYREKFGFRVQKVSVSVAKTCPNREGLAGMKTCIFCDKWGSAPAFVKADWPMLDQLKYHRERIRKRYKANKFLLYFQSYTNTFGRLSELKKHCEEALQQEDIVGIVIGTRPDCLPKGALKFFGELAEQTYLSIELGIQTFDDQQLIFLRRGHDKEAAIRAIKQLKKIPNLNICAHLIFGIPGESDQQLIDAANLLNELSVDGVKLHNLHVLKNTPLAEEYSSGNFSPIDLRDYAERVVLFLENLDQKISIHRLTAVAPRWDELIAPEWTKEKMRPVQYIENLLAIRETWQGRMLETVS